tara:strand:- start:65 stop:325 length:261 start_codon:yes stop_codon:yes gene_type:complete
MIKIKRLKDALEVIGEEFEDYIANAIQDAISIFRDDELEEAKREAYDNTSEVDYRVDNADNEIDDLKNKISELENRLDSLEEKDND